MPPVPPSPTAPAFHWFLPTRGDGRFVSGVGTGIGPRAGAAPGAVTREPTLLNLGQIARAAEAAGFEAVLTPTGSGCEDAWLAAAALIPLTTTLQFLVAFRPGLIGPALAAHQARSFQRLSGGRLKVNIVTGGDPAEQRSYGDLLDHDARYARTDEFLALVRRNFAGETVDHAGEHFTVEGFAPTLPATAPEIYFGGASPAGLEVAARHADVHLSWGETPEALAPRLRRLTERAAGHGRTLRFGLRVHVISRDAPEQAWAEADRMLASMSPETVARARDRFARMDSVGQARMSALSRAALAGGTADVRPTGPRTTGGPHDPLLIGPNLWAGVGLVREGAGTALVGSHEQVAERLDAYRAVGVSEFVLSGWPHVEEAYRVGEQVLPLLGAGAARR